MLILPLVRTRVAFTPGLSLALLIWETRSLAVAPAGRVARSMSMVLPLTVREKTPSAGKGVVSLSSFRPT
ncbi:hypothetical protein D3C85_1890700 [compost metagenome]